MRKTDGVKLNRTAEEPYVFDGVVADPELLLVRREGAVLDLEPKALRVLFCLIRNRGRVLSKDELIGEAWAGVFVSDNSLTRAVAQLRRQLGDNARAPRYIETCSTVGYRFIGEVEVKGDTKPSLSWLGIALALLAFVLTAAWLLATQHFA